MRIRHWLGAAVLGLALVGATRHAAAQINGVNVQPRVFNDFPDSNLTITNNYPTLVKIDDHFVTAPAGKFANRHDALLSADGGATPFTFNNNQGFDVSADVTLQVGSAAPRKETGIRVNSSVGGDGLFIVNSDAGEIVAFGGALPFFKFGDNAGGNGYTPGQTINMRLIYDAAAHTITYDVTQNGVTKTSGPLAFTNLENGVIDGSNVGFYGQFSPNANSPSTDFGTASFQNIVATLVPEPTTLAGLCVAVGALAFRRRR